MNENNPDPDLDRVMRSIAERLADIDKQLTFQTYAISVLIGMMVGLLWAVTKVYLKLDG